MRNKIIFFLLTWVISSSCIAVHSQFVKPVVFACDANSMAANKSKVSANDKILAPAYNQLLKNAENALQFGPVSVMEKKNIPPSGDKHDYMSLAPYHWPDPSTPDGLPYIRKDGQTNPEVKEYKDKEYMPQLCDKIFTLSAAYYFSGEIKFAEHASKLIKVWFLEPATKMNPNLNFSQAMKGTNTGRGAGLIDARHFIKLIDAIGMLPTTKSWSELDQKGMRSWFSDFLNWMQTSNNGKDEINAPNNHGVWYDALRLSISLFINDLEKAKNVIANAQNRLDKQMDKAGNFPKEMERTTSFHYTVFVMDAFFSIAQMAEKAGINFWEYKSPSGNSLKKGFDQLLPFLAKEKKWEGPQIKEFDFEEGLQLLTYGFLKFNCKNCKELIKNIAAEKTQALLINLLY